MLLLHAVALGVVVGHGFAVMRVVGSAAAAVFVFVVALPLGEAVFGLGDRHQDV